MSDIEGKIAKLLLKMARFEFFLIDMDPEFASIHPKNGLDVVDGICWGKLAKIIEGKQPFLEFDFDAYSFKFLKDTVPQQIVISSDKKLKWDSDPVNVDSWSVLLAKSYARVRNNLAHGNKALKPAYFADGRTEKFLEAADALIDFIAIDIFSSKGWEKSLFFQ